MRRSLLALSAFSLVAFVVACSASGSSAGDDADTDTTIPAVDSGKTGKPVNGNGSSGNTAGDDDDDDDTTTTDAGKDAGKPKDGGAVADASIDATVPDAGGPPPPVDAGGGPCSFTGVLAKYDLSGLSGSAAKADVTTVNGGITATSIVRNNVAAASASGALNASGWPTAAALDPAKYFSLTLTAPAGCAFKTSTVVVDLKASGSGPANGSVATSGDAFASTTGASTAGAAVTLPIVVDTAAGQTLEVRIYGYGATAASGTLRVDNALTINGALH